MINVYRTPPSLAFYYNSISKNLRNILVSNAGVWLAKLKLFLKKKIYIYIYIYIYITVVLEL